jgi:hypothetical protein
MVHTHKDATDRQLRRYKMPHVLGWAFLFAVLLPLVHVIGFAALGFFAIATAATAVWLFAKALQTLF